MQFLGLYAHSIGRVFLSILFIAAGVGKLGNVDGFAQYMASGGVPAALAWPVVLFEILGGLAILVGFQTRLVAFAFAGFCLLSGFLYHFDPADQMQMTQLMKNIGLAGGFLMLFAHGAGKLSLDERKA